jgi:D-amino-acid dehydrogenase
VDFKLNHGGILELFRDERGARQRDAYADTLDHLGVNTVRLSPEECVAVEPSLAGVVGTIRAGLMLSDDAWGDARQFTVATESASRALGVEYRFSTSVKHLAVRNGRVTGVETDGGLITADHVVVCGGSYSKELLGHCGISLPVAPVKGYSITLAKTHVPVMPSLPLLDDLEKIAVAPIEGKLRVAGMVEFDGYDETIRPARVRSLARSIQRLYPEIRLPEDLSPWAGLRPMAADGLPIIDETPVSNLFVNTGHGGLGWTLACGSARLLTDIITQRPMREANPFRLSRRFW